MIVTIKPKHIKEGLVKSHTHHPVAFAIRDAICEQFDLPDINVHLLWFSGICFIDGAIWYLPHDLAEYCQAFDTKTSGIEPSEFEIPDFPPEGYFVYKKRKE